MGKSRGRELGKCGKMNLEVIADQIQTLGGICGLALRERGRERERCEVIHGKKVFFFTGRPEGSSGQLSAWSCGRASPGA